MTAYGLLQGVSKNFPNATFWLMNWRVQRQTMRHSGRPIQRDSRPQALFVVYASLVLLSRLKAHLLPAERDRGLLGDLPAMMDDGREHRCRHKLTMSSFY